MWKTRLFAVALSIGLAGVAAQAFCLQPTINAGASTPLFTPEAIQYKVQRLCGLKNPRIFRCITVGIEALRRLRVTDLSQHFLICVTNIGVFLLVNSVIITVDLTLAATLSPGFFSIGGWPASDRQGFAGTAGCEYSSGTASKTSLVMRGDEGRQWPVVLS
jgi:hypothetical protein